MDVEKYHVEISVVHLFIDKISALSCVFVVDVTLVGGFSTPCTECMCNLDDISI